MRTSNTNRWFTGTLATALAVVLSCGQLLAQTPAPESPKQKPSPHLNRVIVENAPAAPQVVTILHRLNGVKFIGLLIRSGSDVEAINKFEDFNLTGEVHTSVIAGLALDDGRTIAAWLPEAEAELPPPLINFTPRAPQVSHPPLAAPPNPPQPVNRVAPLALSSLPSLPSLDFPLELLEPADLRVITRDGKRVTGHYIGLDGLTGLSLITVANSDLPPAVATKEETITVGQRLRVIGPQPAPGSEPGVKSAIYVRIGETEAVVTDVSRSPSGSVARVRIKSAKLSAANIGGIAIANDGDTLGIVDAVKGNEATIVPLALVRQAAKRVMARQASVPRPWLGIRGEPIGAVALDRIVGIGWELERARALTEMHQGIMLTAVVPGSPAALAKLKPGDVILSVNNGFVRNANDLSWLLDEAGPENLVRFTVARPEIAALEALEIKLSESPDPRLRSLDRRIERIYKRRSLAVEGVEAVALKPRAAATFGASGGLLVVSVQPATEAFKAGLRPGDVIESIDGIAVTPEAVMVAPQTPATNSVCVIVRNKERIVLKFQYSTNHYSKKPEPPKN
jgi:S1-C subfamily serine protease